MSSCNGIHIHPHDITDEGVEAIKTRLRAMGDIKYIFAEVNTIFERNPVPVGILPHNPVHDVVMGDATLHVDIDFSQCRLQQVKHQSLQAGEDCFNTLKENIAPDEFTVIPWVNVLNGHFTGDLDNNHVVDYKGVMQKHWICPNGSDVIDLWKTIFLGIKKQYGYNTFLIDRIRYPDWAGEAINPDQLYTCFCDKCCHKMTAQGLNVTAIKQRLGELVALLEQKEFEAFPLAFKNDPLIQSWVAFKQASVTEFVANLKQAMHAVDAEIELWLDLWSPKYSWLLGQNYTDLTKHASALKHFPYHKLGGGADVQGLINFYAHNEAEQERMFHSFLSLFDMPYDLSYQQFKQSGYPIEFVRDMNNHVRELSQDGTFIFSGIQMWNLPENELIDAITAANTSDCNALLYYCYGWAGDELFNAVSQFNAETL
ncbi:hypothetical protein [Photobacterium nomapromontoriensis]|uniref:hypothetical protein n=1 Tax=Photobacterium nomapromontoriensis TaxID=2910237 RepID=UPI003D11678C